MANKTNLSLLQQMADVCALEIKHHEATIVGVRDGLRILEAHQAARRENLMRLREQLAQQRRNTRKES